MMSFTISEVTYILHTYICGVQLTILPPPLKSFISQKIHVQDTSHLLCNAVVLSSFCSSFSSRGLVFHTDVDLHPFHGCYGGLWNRWLAMLDEPVIDQL